MSEDANKIDDLQKGVNLNEKHIALLTQSMDTTNTTIEKLCVTISDDTKETRKALKGIDEALRGSKETPGLFVRMALLEQYAKRMKQAAITLVGAIITAGIAGGVWLAGVFGHKH